MANVLIEENTLKAIGNAIRAKTGKTDLILPKDMEVEIGKITGGSGNSSDLVKYVTFMNEDGTTELFKMPVLSGDDCKDPVSHGDITTPTKESTNTTNYAHNGWALASGGSADSSALKNVTEDRIVYASFAESVRYYTVNFYTEVGALYETVQVTYGGKALPSVNPEKSGYALDGWQPSNENITADTDCYAIWEEVKATFANSTWSEIAQISEEGKAKACFNLGDTRTILLDGKEIELMIAGFDHDDLQDGSGKAGITIISNTMANNLTSVYGNTIYYNNNDLKINTHGLKEKLPDDLKPYIKKVVKKINSALNQTILYNITEEVFALSVKEINASGKISVQYVQTGTPYEAFLQGYATIQARVHGTEEYSNYWLKQNEKYAFLRALCVTNNGTVASSTAGSTDEYPLRFGFCI